MKTTMKIMSIGCWNCKKDMKIALVDNTMPVSRLDDGLLEIARQHGVIIKESFSKTMEESYNACICPHCNSMFGDWFYHDYWYDIPIETIDVELNLDENKG